jgi:hypothetical protein
MGLQIGWDYCGPFPDTAVHFLVSLSVYGAIPLLVPPALYAELSKYTFGVYLNLHPLVIDLYVILPVFWQYLSGRCRHYS